MNSLIVAFLVAAGLPMPEADPQLGGGAEIRSAIADVEETVRPSALVTPAIRTFDIGPPAFDPEEPVVIA